MGCSTCCTSYPIPTKRMIGEVAHKVEAVRVELKQQMQEEYRQYALTNPIE